MSSSDKSPKILHPHEADGGEASKLAEHGLKPMEAVVALYSERDSEVAAAIVASANSQTAVTRRLLGKCGFLDMTTISLHQVVVRAVQ